MSEYATESKSSVSVEGTAKGDAVPKIKTYEGVSDEEMERLSTLAVETFLSTRRKLAASGEVALA